MKDWRKNHKFYDFTYQTENNGKCGLKPFDKIISHKKISPIKIMLPQTKRLGYIKGASISSYLYETLNKPSYKRSNK